MVLILVTSEFNQLLDMNEIQRHFLNTRILGIRINHISHTFVQSDTLKVIA